MTQKTAKNLRWRPLSGYLTAIVVGGLAVLLETGGEALRLALRYSRPGLADGELWRLLTGHLVHLGPSHMLMNVAALAVLALIFRPVLTQSAWILTLLLAAASINAGLYFAHPAVEWYVGLSGVLHGIWAGGSLLFWTGSRPQASALLALLILKLGYETILGPVPLTGALAAGPVVAEAHLWGAIGGALAAALLLAIRRLPRPL